MKNINSLLIELDNLELTMAVQALPETDKQKLEELFDEYSKDGNVSALLLKLPTLSQDIQNLTEILMTKVDSKDLLGAFNKISQKGNLNESAQTFKPQSETETSVEDKDNEVKFGKNPMLSKPFYKVSKALDNISKKKDSEHPNKLATAGALFAETTGDIVKMVATGEAPPKVSSLNERKPETVSESLILTGKLFGKAVKEKTPIVVDKAKQVTTTIESKAKDTFTKVSKNTVTSTEKIEKVDYEKAYDEIMLKDIENAKKGIYATEEVSSSTSKSFLEKLKEQTNKLTSQLMTGVDEPTSLHESLSQENLRKQAEIQKELLGLNDEDKGYGNIPLYTKKRDTEQLRESATRKLKIEATSGYSTDSSLNDLRYSQLKKVADYLNEFSFKVTPKIIKADGTELEVNDLVTFKVAKTNQTKAVINLVLTKSPTTVIEKYEYTFEAGKVPNDYIALGNVINLAIPTANLDTAFEDLQALEENIAISYAEPDSDTPNFGTYTEEWDIEKDGKILKVISDTWAFKSKLN